MDALSLQGEKLICAAERHDSQSFQDRTRTRPGRSLKVTSDEFFKLTTESLLVAWKAVALAMPKTCVALLRHAASPIPAAP
jgi:hypothetical protein